MPCSHLWGRIWFVSLNCIDFDFPTVLSQGGLLSIWADENDPGYWSLYQYQPLQSWYNVWREECEDKGSNHPTGSFLMCLFRLSPSLPLILPGDTQTLGINLLDLAVLIAPQWYPKSMPQFVGFGENPDDGGNFYFLLIKNISYYFWLCCIFVAARGLL